MKKIILIALSMLLAAVFTGCGSSVTGPGSVSLKISDRDVDVQYMTATDLTVFGAVSSSDLDMGGTLHIDFTEHEALETDENLMLVSGSGELALYGRRYTFTIEDELMSRVKVSDTNTVYESIITCSADIGGGSVELSIDMVASEDFSQAVATVSAGEGILFFGDIFNDYLEYYNMILAGAING